jgi:intron-binding protein aquarius
MKQRFVEFLTDMLSQLPTRRFVRTVLEDRGVLPKCRLSGLFAHPKGKLFAQLVDLFKFYIRFEVDDHTGAQLTDDEMAARHYERLQQLQRLAFKHWPQLHDLALSHCAAIEKRPALLKHLQALSTEELSKLAVLHLRLVRHEQPWCGDRAYLLEVLVSNYEQRRSQRQAISDMPLYPNEEMLWDDHLVPSGSSNGADAAMALPKLNLQFLTLHDYLLRNFNLFRLEATYQVREDLADVLARVAPVTPPDGSGRVVFSGWARMAIPPMSFAIVDVRKPNVGETKPAAVTAEIKYDLASLRPAIRAEWDELRQHDILFLLAVQPPSGGGSSPAERHGLRSVRGCEVIELRDADGKPMNSARRDVQMQPKGTQRTLLVAMDAAQYHLDVTRQVDAGGADVYAGLNLLVRRKPEENNFKAILECIRDMMQEDFNHTVPEWLHDMFLGYGDPAAAHHSSMADAIATVDAKDTFLDSQHLVDCFSGREIVYTNVAPGATPSPPFRLTFPELLRNVEAEGEATASTKRKLDDPKPPLIVEVRLFVHACMQ